MKFKYLLFYWIIYYYLFFIKCKKNILKIYIKETHKLIIFFNSFLSFIIKFNLILIKKIYWIIKYYIYLYFIIIVKNK